jgi:hypothetical protein
VENVTVENCVFWCDWGKTIELWCGQKPTTIREITVKDCYFIHLSSSALNIATWYGSKASVVEKVLFQNIFIDGETEYASLVVEKPDQKAYTPKPDFIPFLFRASAEKLGVMNGLGTQICLPVEDYSVFRIRYRNILLDSIHCDDSRLKVDVCQLTDGVLSIENVRTENCDFPIEIRTAQPANRPQSKTEVKK